MKTLINRGIILVSLLLLFIPNISHATTPPPAPPADKTKPTITFAYVLDEKFYIEIDDEGGFGEEPFEVTIDGEDVDDFDPDGYEVDVPSKIIIKITDAAKNSIEQTFNVTMSDQILSGKVPEKIKDKISKNQESDVDVLKGFNRVVEGDYNKVLNIYNTFEDIILDEFGPHNDGDIVITGTGLNVDNDYNVTLNKEGLFSFKIGHIFYTQDTFNVYVYVDNDGVKHTNINDIKVVNSGLIDQSSVKLLDFLVFDLFKEGYKPVTTYIMAKDVETGKIVSLEESINIEDDKLYKYSLHDILSGKDFFIEFKKPKPIEVKSASYPDVKGDHWAFYSIKNLTLNSFINGYPDGTFKPSANITVREFSTMLSRYLSKIDKSKLQPVVEDYYLGAVEGEWGSSETKAVLSTIPRSKMSLFNLTYLDRPIMREEVALLLSSNLVLEVKEINSLPIDTLTSKYSMELFNVIAAGLMKGYPDNTFKPALGITRAEVATIFDRLLFPDDI